LPRSDGELGTYLGLISESPWQGCVVRFCFWHGLHNPDERGELGFATHYIPSRQIPILLDRLASLKDAHISVIDGPLRNLFLSVSEELPTPLTGETRIALDWGFRHDRGEDILADLESLRDHSNPSMGT